MLGALMYTLIWAPLQLIRLLRIWNWKIEGVERLPPRTTGFVLASNHLNWLDIAIIGASLPLTYRPWWIAKVEIFQNPIIAWWFHQMHVIPINRGKRDMAALNAAERALTDERAVLIIFPEGHRSRNGGLQEGRSGAVRLAARTGCPIMPMAVWGTERGLKGAFRRTPIRVVFGEAYHPQAPAAHIPFTQMNELTEEMMLRIAALLPEERWGHYRDRMLAMKA
jgi:1-acyl-sn-glycerol-3-phosphate acyltransferase